MRMGLKTRMNGDELEYEIQCKCCGKMFFSHGMLYCSTKCGCIRERSLKDMCIEIGANKLVPIRIVARKMCITPRELRRMIFNRHLQEKIMLKKWGNRWVEYIDEFLIEELSTNAIQV